MENRCIIISGGVFGPVPEKQPGDFIIACDRGYVYCERLGLTPDLFIGDFDSYSGAVAPGVAVERLIPEKDDTDTGHAITYALSHGFRELVLVCALGGRLDHTLANLQNAANAAAQGMSVTILDEKSEITFLTRGMLRLKKRPGWGLSVFSLSDASTGGSWPLSTSWPGCWGYPRRPCGSKATIFPIPAAATTSRGWWYSRTAVP